MYEIENSDWEGTAYSTYIADKFCIVIVGKFLRRLKKNTKMDLLELFKINLFKVHLFHEFHKHVEHVWLFKQVWHVK